MTPRHAYNRRSDEERIADLQSRIEDLQRKVEEQKRADSPVVREAQKLAKRLREFAQLAAQHQRLDVTNSTLAFLAGLDRMLNPQLDSRRRGRDEYEDQDES